MEQLTAEGRRIVEDVAQRHGVSVEAATTMLAAVAAGGGGQAQFNVAELGGMGQWSRGGMTMVGDMFNHGLKARVDALCAELSGLVAGAQVYAPASSQSQSQGQGHQGQWQGAGAGGVSLFVAGGGGRGAAWPEALGRPASTGAQNDLRYAVFPETRRLAIDVGGRVTVYDTLDHRIGGVSQQQSGDRSLTFTSQRGLVRVADLPVVDGEGRGAKPAAAGDAPSPAGAPAEPAPAAAAPPFPIAPPVAPSRPAATPPAAPVQAGGEDDIFLKIERLAGLRQKGILTEPEFEAKKAELLARL